DRPAAGGREHLGDLGRGGPVGRLLRQAPPADLADLVGYLGQLRQRGRFGVLVRLQHLGDRLGLPRHLAGEQAVQEDAERVHVGGRYHLAAAQPLRRQIRRGTPEKALGRLARVTGDGGDAEVDDLRAGRGEQYVAGL